MAKSFSIFLFVLFCFIYIITKVEHGKASCDSHIVMKHDINYTLVISHKVMVIVITCDKVDMIGIT